MKAEDLAWIIALPAAAECIASVWLPEMEMGGYDVKTIFLNVSGAALEGFFAALNDGVVLRGALGSSIASLASAVRGSFLAAYTSWAGMVYYSGVIAKMQGSVLAGIAYLMLSVSMGMVAFFMGSKLATALGHSGAPATMASIQRARVGLLGGMAAFIAASYASVRADLTGFDDKSGVSSELPSLLSFLDEEENRLLVAMACAVAGAASGNYVGGLIDGSGSTGVFALGTLGCNILFGLLGLSLPVATLRRSILQRSVLLQSFAGSFCGAASAFAGHCADSCGLWRIDKTKALTNVAYNLLGASFVCILGYEVEKMLAEHTIVDVNSNGVVELVELASFYHLASAPPAPPPPRKFWPF